MAILNFGSLNLDFVYRVDHIVLPGETIFSGDLGVFCGGKGLNQSVALARAGASVSHAGMIGPDGGPLLAVCRENGVGDAHILRVEERTGNAVIQVDASGQNSIVLFGGANRMNSLKHIESTLGAFVPGDTVLLQNEINLAGEIMEAACARGLRIVLNPSPYDEVLASCPLEKVSVFILNEVEGWQMTGERDPDAILRVMGEKYPAAEVVLTLGGEGAVRQAGGVRTRQRAFAVPVADTTAAGDTFTGYYLASRQRGLSVAASLETAALAAALAVSRRGATDSIPWLAEVEAARTTFGT